MKDIPKEVVYYLLLVYIVLLFYQSYTIFTYAPTGYAGTSIMREVTLCYNGGPPAFVLPLDCPTIITAGESFFCDIDATEPDDDNVTFTDNSTLFTIGLKTGIIVFTPGLSALGNQSANITIKDSTSCEGNMHSTVINWTVRKPRCGNEVIEIGEECDDGNTANKDGCSSTCKDEAEETSTSGGGQTEGAGQKQKTATKSQTGGGGEDGGGGGEDGGGGGEDGGGGGGGEDGGGGGEDGGGGSGGVPIGKAFEYQTGIPPGISAWQSIVSLSVLLLVIGGYAAYSFKAGETAVKALAKVFSFMKTSHASMKTSHAPSQASSLVSSQGLQDVRSHVLDLYNAVDAKNIDQAKELYTTLRKKYEKLDKKEKILIHRDILVLYKRIEDLVKK